MEILAFILLVIIVIIALPFIKRAEKKAQEKSEIERWNRQFDLEKKQADELLTDLTSKCELLFNNKSTEPVTFEIKELPNDFDEVEYTAFDFETGNRDPLSAISLGIAHFKGNELLEVKEFVFNPINKDEFIFTHIHGLTENDVNDKSSFEDQFEEISNELNGRLLVAHNAEFDCDVLKAHLTHINKRLTKTKISCTYKLSKRFMKYESSYKLESLCREYNIPYWSHKAGYDAVSAGILFMHCLAQSPGGSVTESAMRGRNIALKPIKIAT